MPQRTSRRWLNCLIPILLITAPAARPQSHSLNVPDGFRSELYADDDLAHDIHSMTIDHLGRVVVAGPGYIRILHDHNKDGKADAFTEYAEQPATGAQGLYVLGTSLLCSGDEGLLLFRDADQDDIADGPPQTVLKIEAGGEHHVHSIQRGPDGWWYVNAGNFAGVTASYATLPTSPLKTVHGGVLMRLKPDLSGGELLSDGFRNAYDFAFTPSGDIFTFDSDGERDITLPWYRPTRVFQITPMSNAGWVSTSWKRPATFSDMPPVAAEFGRGSPTGVLCYRHHQFPEAYHNAVFVLDWTVGRIFALPLEQSGSVWATQPIEFASARGQFGFAPTDAAVGADGSLFVSVGGRGTRGGVFRISYEGNTQSPAGNNATETPGTTTSARDVVSIDQPLSSWSRARWMPVARKLGAESFRRLAINERITIAERVRAIEVLVELFGGPGTATANSVAASRSPLVRGRLAWALGRSKLKSDRLKLLVRLLVDRDPFVQRNAVEAFASVFDQQLLNEALPGIAKCLSSSDRSVRLAAAYLVGRLSKQQITVLNRQLAPSVRGRVWLAMGLQLRPVKVDMDAAELAAATFVNSGSDRALRQDALRLLQLSLGDVGPGTDRPAMFHGYGTPQNLEAYESRLNPIIAALADSFPTGDADLDHELIRLIAMTSPYNRSLFEKLLAQINEESGPAFDIHCLATLARFQLERSFGESTATARALLSIDVKVRERHLRQDSNWDDRIGELYTALCEVDPALPSLLVKQPEFGEPGHVLYMSRVPQNLVPDAISAYVAKIRSDPEFRWNNDVVFLIGESQETAHRDLLRRQLDNLAIRDALLIVLADAPLNSDRAAFVSGLSSTQLNAVKACADALKNLPRSSAPAEQFELLSAARRLINDQREYELRELMIRLLQNNTGQSRGFKFGKDGHLPQPEALRSWQTYLEERYVDFRPPSASESTQRIYTTLKEADWSSGRADAGQRLFEKLSCARCHGGRKALGPDLTGVAKRFSRDDLFASMIEPDRDVSSRYQTTSVVTTSGKVFTGLVVYKSVDGMLLRDAEQNTYRFEEAEIESQQRRRTSLMPSGLLKNVDAQGMADLYQYLRSL